MCQSFTYSMMQKAVYAEQFSDVRMRIRSHGLSQMLNARTTV